MENVNNGGWITQVRKWKYK